MVLANVGDSRAVLATISDDGSLVPVQLTTDFKPNLPRKLPSISNDHYLKTCFIESKILSCFSLFFFIFFVPSEEAERITQCKGRVFSLSDEPGVYRVWLPNKDTPGLAMSRAFGDYRVKNFGLISVPEVTQRVVTDRDQFIVLATDGVSEPGTDVLLIDLTLAEFTFTTIIQ